MLLFRLAGLTGLPDVWEGEEDWAVDDEPQSVDAGSYDVSEAEEISVHVGGP